MIEFIRTFCWFTEWIAFAPTNKSQMLYTVLDVLWKVEQNKSSIYIRLNHAGPIPPTYNGTGHTQVMIIIIHEVDKKMLIRWLIFTYILYENFMITQSTPILVSFRIIQKITIIICTTVITGNLKRSKIMVGVCVMSFLLNNYIYYTIIIPHTFDVMSSVYCERYLEEYI